MDRVAKSLRDGKLLLVPSGTSNSSSADLLGSEKMRDLLARLRENYDFVVVDSPPLASVIDATVLAKMVDKIIYIVEWEKVPREVVARAIDTIGVDRDKIAGVVLNKANIRKMSRYLPYYSYYNSRKFTKYYDG
jgi:succinoglycan biosynthesis transport protein ExoP